MFKEARIKLTAWYLVIVMAISFGFSGVIYASINQELMRFDNAQQLRQQRVDSLSTFLLQQGVPMSLGQQPQEFENVDIARTRIILSLVVVNISILLISGIGGYFLAGQTLEPISKMVKEQKEFVGNASHELRTPLTSLKTEIEVGLRDKKMKINGARDLLKSNLEDVNRMQKLSNYLLVLNRYENGDTNLDTKKINLAKIVSEAVKKNEFFASQKKIKIVSNITPVLVRGNEGATSELTSILLENAIKYSGSAKKINVSVTKNGVLTVKDYGIGITDADLLHIFDRFYRADSSRSKSDADGYGLGLSIAKSIADKLGAKIKVQSKLGKGSTFSVQFRSDIRSS